MKLTKLNFSAALMAVIVTTIIVAGSTYAYEGYRAQKLENVDSAKLEELKQAVENKDFVKADEIRKELGLKGFHQRGMERRMFNPEIMEAFKNNDYAAWKDIASERCEILAKINEDNFAKFAEAHKLMAAGDRDGAKAIFDELGIEKK